METSQREHTEDGGCLTHIVAKVLSNELEEASRSDERLEICPPGPDHTTAIVGTQPGIRYHPQWVISGQDHRPGAFKRFAFQTEWPCNVRGRQSENQELVVKARQTPIRNEAPDISQRRRFTSGKAVGSPSLLASEPDRLPFREMI